VSNLLLQARRTVNKPEHGGPAFYELMDELRDRCGGYRRLATCSSASGWPQRGVYFFFDDDEPRFDGAGARVVRVGTHALTKGSKSSLWGRLSQHRGTDGGRNPGGGNHRGSIFRLHVGTALLHVGSYPRDLARSWGQGSSADRSTRDREASLERDVSHYIRALPFLWVPVDDPPGPPSERGVIEASAIALLSAANGKPVDGVSPRWLGRHADRAAVRESGLWNVRHITDRPDLSFLQVLERRIKAFRR
jgi:hypothetical protein